MGRRFEKKVTTNGTVTLRQRYLYRGYLQIACLDLTRANQPALPSTPLQGYAVTGWYITWDPTQPTATRPLALQKDGTWYTYKTADGCKAGWTCVVRHAPVGRGAERRLRVNWDLIRLRVSLRSLATPRQAKNITEVYGPNGFIRTTYTYTPYGTATTDGDVDQPIQWSSEYHDTETALIYYNYRYYNPTDGRWTRRDPIGIEGGINLYSYTENRPLDRVDILGNSLGCFGKCRKKCGGAKCCRTGDDGCCEKRTLKQNEDFDNTHNGCGSDDFISSKVPNLIFKPACDAHDICYGTCGNSKARCDMEFKLAMYALCEKADADWFKANRYDLIGDIVHASGAYVYYCKKIADTYYNAVDSLAGDYIFSVTQDKACLWEKC